MKVFTANIKSNPLMRQSRVESDIEHAMHLGGVGFWQEIAPKRYKASLARNATKKQRRVFGIEAECPVTLGPEWGLVYTRLHKMHKGRLFVTPTRYAVEVRAHNTAVPIKVCFIGTHMISSAWSTRHMGTRAWRRKMWWIHFNRLKSIIAAAHHDGYNVLMGLDANHGITTMALHPDQVVVSHHRIDGVIAVPAPGYKVTHGVDRPYKGFFTDHEPVVVTAGFVPVK